LQRLLLCHMPLRQRLRLLLVLLFHLLRVGFVSITLTFRFPLLLKLLAFLSLLGTDGERYAAYTTNIAMLATNMSIVAIATIIHPQRELGWPCISFLSAATIRIATRRKGASNPLMIAVQ
jgi:hypothetical protein